MYCFLWGVGKKLSDLFCGDCLVIFEGHVERRGCNEICFCGGFLGEVFVVQNPHPQLVGMEGSVEQSEHGI